MDEILANQWPAVLGLLACGAVWLGMALGQTRRLRLQAQGRLLWLGLRQRLRSPLRARHARQQASDAIEHARRTPKVDRDGNVYRPDRFQQGRDGRDKLH